MDTGHNAEPLKVSVAVAPCFYSINGIKQRGFYNIITPGKTCGPVHSDYVGKSIGDEYISLEKLITYGEIDLSIRLAPEYSTS